jgi:hypothetical protein
LSDRDLLLVGVAMESGELPLVHQHGYAEFRPVVNDHRLITASHGVLQYEAADSPAPGTPAAGESREGSSSVGAGPSPVHSAAEGAQAGEAARQLLRTAVTLVDVIDEDSRDLPLYFPQFTSQVIYDERLRMWYREGWLQPLAWHNARFVIRYYYPEEPLALPIVVATPIRVPSPHLWRQQCNGCEFPSLCYTFAPDHTVDRRYETDIASEVLRQVVLWLIKHIVWCRFGFWAGAEVGHDPTEILRHARPDGPCPSHTWKRYGDCCRVAHLAEVERRRRLRYGINPARRIVQTDQR